MRYMYTTKEKADEGCHEVAAGVFGRPVREDHRKKLRKAGWVESVGDLKPDHAAIPDQLIAAYEAKFGKKPHHRVKIDTIVKSLEQAKDDENNSVSTN